MALRPGPRLLRALVTCAALAGAFAAPAQGAERLFAPTSVWNTPLRADSGVDPTSAARVGALARSVEASQARGLYPNIASDTFSTPIYRVGANAPRVPVTLDTGAWADSLRGALAAGVPIPRDAAPAKGTDGHLTVYQPATDTLWEFWRASKRADGWHAAWGGVIRGVSSDPGHYSDRSVPGLDAGQGWNWGATASSLPVAAGTVTRAELRRGRIDHALAAAIPNPCQDVFAWPAQRTDGRSRASDCMPEGARLRLDPSLDLRRMKLPRTTRILARAAQKYGIVVRDRTGGSVSLFFESPIQGRRPVAAGAPGWKLMSRFPWRKLQLQRMELCSETPCRR